MKLLLAFVFLPLLIRLHAFVETGSSTNPCLIHVQDRHSMQKNLLELAKKKTTQRVGAGLSPVVGRQLVPSGMELPLQILTRSWHQ